MTGWHEPYEPRGSRTDLWGAKGEIALVYPALLDNFHRIRWAPSTGSPGQLHRITQVVHHDYRFLPLSDPDLGNIWGKPTAGAEANASLDHHVYVEVVIDVKSREVVGKKG